MDNQRNAKHSASTIIETLWNKKKGSFVPVQKKYSDPRQIRVYSASAQAYHHGKIQIILKKVQDPSRVTDEALRTSEPRAHCDE